MSFHFERSAGFVFILIVQCYYRTVGLVNKIMAVDQVASQRAASDAPLAGYPWRSVKRAFCFSPFHVCFMSKVLWYFQALRPSSYSYLGGAICFSCEYA